LRCLSLGGLLPCLSASPDAESGWICHLPFQNRPSLGTSGN